MQSEPINSCTYNRTQNDFSKQYWKRCYDCWPTKTNNPDEPQQGACIECIAVCHEGHTVDSKVRFGNFYCDCGSEHKGCKLSNFSGPNIQPIFIDPIIPTPLPGGGNRFPYPHPIPQPIPHLIPHPNPSNPQRPPIQMMSTPPQTNTNFEPPAEF